MHRDHRLLLPDLLKGIAVLLMVQVHITELFVRPEFLGSSAARLSLFLGGPFAAPVFMAVMGYFLFKDGRNGHYYFIRGAKLLLWGFLLNIGLNTHLFIHIFTGSSQLDPLYYLFGVDILFLAGISVILIGILRMFLKKTLWVYFLLAFVIAFIGPYFPAFAKGGSASFIAAFFGGNYSWSYFPVFPWFAYVLAGYSFKGLQTRYEGKIRNNKFYKPVLILIMLLCFVFAPYAIKVSANLSTYYHHGILFFLWMLSFLVFYVFFISRISKFLPAFIRNYLAWAGKKVTAFYVLQWLLIGNIATAVYKIVLPINALVFYFAILALVSVVLFLIDFYKRNYGGRISV